MKPYTPQELQAILDAHREWIYSGYEKGARANLAGGDQAL